MKKHNAIIYQLHEMQQAGLKTYFNALAAPLEMQAQMTGLPFFAASAEMSRRMAKDYDKPEFGLDETRIDDTTVTVTEEIMDDRAFGTLLHFKRDTTRKDPKVLLVAPMSGHHATLLRDTVEGLLPNHDVYITDWKDARNVPLDQGDFGFDDYVAYIKDFIEGIGPDVHVIAVCQPTVPVLAAISLLAEEKPGAAPLSMTLMAGPIDTSKAETEVTKLATTKSLDWFAENMVAQVPEKYDGAGRLVYPGFLQLTAFMSMNPEKHTQAHIDMFGSLCTGDLEKAQKIKAFYDEYLAVADMSAKFYLETVQKVFMDRELATGKMVCDGKKVNPAAITKTPLFTVEGGKDDIVAPGQTIAAHYLCENLKDDQRFHYVQKGAGHYGVFNGRHWRDGICPRVTGFIRAVGEKLGMDYAPAAKNTAVMTPDKLGSAPQGPASAPQPPERKFGT